ncbi:MAG: phospho-N-acetylmuramoyl-pentapeptide-transferase, partial [Pseudomonadota bacterium]
MLYYFLVPLSEHAQIFNVFRYLTFRTGGAVMTALLIAFVLGPSLIDWMRARQGKGQPIREDGPQSHIIEKAGTPTMGGVLILVSVFVSTLLWGDLGNTYVWIVLLVTLSYGALGFADDYLKVTKQNTGGVSARAKLAVQFAIAIAAGWACMNTLAATPDSRAGIETAVAVPFFKDLFLNLGWFFVPFAAVVIAGFSNAVNLTDGLDGLAIVPVMIAAATFALISYLVGNAVFS